MNIEIDEIIGRSILSGYDLGNGEEPDAMQIDLQWYAPKYGSDSMRYVVDRLRYELERAFETAGI